MVMIRALQLTVLLALIGAGFLLSPVRVSAHADYERSDPGRNATLPEPPAQVDVWFTQEVFKRQGANFVRVFDEQEVQVSEGDGIVDDDDRTHISTTLPSDLPDGLYIVRWFTTSDEDGDTDNGAFCFSVGVDLPAGPPEECVGDEVEATPTAVPASPTEPAAVETPTEAVADATADASADGQADSDDGGVSAAVIVIGVIAGIAVLAVVVGAVAVWLRRTLA